MRLTYANGLAGQVYRRGDEGYRERCRTLSPAVEHRPRAVVEAEAADDVRAAVDMARQAGLPFAVQATGHGTHAPLDGGVLLRTGRMASVLVDPDRRIARVGPGARWGQVLAAAAPFGLAPLSGSSPTVGVTGYTLGGGMGWLGRRYGLAADSVVGADVVTADGRHRTATADRHPDLFWALRGGGGAFGVVTSLEFRLHPVSAVYAGAAYFPAARAGDFLLRYRDWAAGLPDAMSTAVVLRTLPDSADVPAALRGQRVIVLKAMYAGSGDAGRRLLAPLWKVAGPPLHDEMRPVPYAAAAMGGTAARYLDFVADLADPVVEILTALNATVEIRHWAGAIADARGDAGPAGHRAAQFSVIVDQQVPGLTETLRPHTIGGSFLNFLSDTRRTATAYTPDNHRTLRTIKTAYDPDNFFRAGHNIQPEAPATVRAS